MNKQSSLPLTAIYILDSTGIPIFARRYRGVISEEETVLIGGFISAIDVFTRTELNSGLTDIGMHSQRFYFHASGDYIISIVRETEQILHIDPDLVQILMHIFNRIGVMLDVCSQSAKINQIPLANIIATIDHVVDNIIFEASFEYVDEIYDEGYDEYSLMDEAKSIDISAITTNLFVDLLRDKIED